MRKKIASLLVWLAYKVYPAAREVVIEQADTFKPMKLASAYKIDKKDVRDYLKKNPQYKSYRKAFTALISDTRQMIFTEIARGLEKHELVSFNITKGMFEAKISGQLFVYGIQEGTATKAEAGAQG